MPINWYVALVLIVLVGVGSLVYARTEYRSAKPVNTVAPLKGATWFAGIDFDVCGTQRTSLPENVTNATKQSFYTIGSGVIAITPKHTSDAGHNAVLGRFVSAYKGLTLTATELHLPASVTSSTSTSGKKSRSASSSSGVTYTNGEKCPAGTKDAGKKASVEVTYWPNAFASKQKPSTFRGNPSTLRFSSDQLITVGFVPSGTTLPKPGGSIVTALLDATSGASSTTTTTTTAPSSSTTTTTAPTSTTTTAPSSTTTSTTKG